MKTLVFVSQDETKRVETKVDIFATNAELITPGFDTRFTNMEIVEDKDAVVDGIALTEIEDSWQAIIAFAKQWNYTLSVIDINEDSTETVFTAV